MSTFWKYDCIHESYSDLEIDEVYEEVFYKGGVPEDKKDEIVRNLKKMVYMIILLLLLWLIMDMGYLMDQETDSIQFFS